MMSLYFGLDVFCQLKLESQNFRHCSAEVGKFNLKSNGDEALSDESPQKTNGDEALNVNFP